jgi:hypothetical protein
MVAAEWKHRAPLVEADTTKRQGLRVAADVRRVMAAVAQGTAEVGLREADTAAKSRLSHAIATTEYEPTGPTVGFFYGAFSSHSVYEHLPRLTDSLQHASGKGVSIELGVLIASRSVHRGNSS